MTLLERLRTRRVRILVQFGAALGVAVAIGFAFVDNAAARAAVAALLGAVLLVVVKLAMVAIQGTAAAQAGVAAAQRGGSAPSSDLRALQTEAGTSRAAQDELRAAHDELLARCRRLESELEAQREAVETLHSLSRRVEPSIAETAVLQHEVSYLRETLERIQRTNGSG